MLEQPVHERDGGEGLARAGGHLDQRPGTRLGERRLEPGDGVHLARAQARGVQRGQSRERLTQRGSAEPLAQGLGPVEGEHRARARLRVPQVGEARDGAGRDVHERQLTVVQVLEPGARVVLGLVLVPGEVHALLLALGLDHPHGLSPDEQHVVRGSHLGRVLPHRDPEPRVQVDPGLVLHHPPARRELGVDEVSGSLFGCLVHLLGVPHKRFMRAGFVSSRRTCRSFTARWYGGERVWSRFDMAP